MNLSSADASYEVTVVCVCVCVCVCVSSKSMRGNDQGMKEEKKREK